MVSPRSIAISINVNKAISTPDQDMYQDYLKTPNSKERAYITFISNVKMLQWAAA